MKSLLKILYILLFLLIIILLTGIFLPKENHIESGITIRATPEIIFNQINMLNNWKSWAPWFGADTTMMPVFNEVPSGVGASYRWKSGHSGEGKLMITNSEPYKQVVTLIDYGMNGKSTTSFILNEEQNQTKLIWKVDNTNLGYFERYFLILFKRNMLTTINTGLQNIRQISQDLKLDRISEIEVIETPAQPAMCILDSALEEEIGVRMNEMHIKLSSYLDKRGIQTVGPAFTIYYERNQPDKIKFAYCLPISERTWGWKEYSYIELPQGKAATLTHWGKTEPQKPQKAIEKYARDNNVRLGNLMWEIRKNDPSEEPDTSKWEVQLFYILK
jgi:effector-binding domain-containing protein